MNAKHRPKRRISAIVALALTTCLVCACGGGAQTVTTVTNPAHHAAVKVAGISQTGVGLTKPTAPVGLRIKGGTVYLAESPGSIPDYIFPMYATQYCTTANTDQLQTMLYRPLYWYGNNYKPTVDYDDSIGQRPQFSHGDRTVTIHLNHYTWSDGETVTARDIVFWMNLLKANPADEWCGYVPGRFPDNVVSYSAPDATTFVMHLNRAYNPTWFLYNELSQIVPLPLAWDKTSLNGPAPKASTVNLPDTTTRGAGAVYRFLNAQGAASSSWTTSSLWKVVDGPFRLSGYTQDGQVTLKPNDRYSGSPKPQIDELVELPFSSNAELSHEITANGPAALTLSALPAGHAEPVATVAAQGYRVSRASSYSINFFPLNFNNPTVGSVFRQRYFRQALQRLVNQTGWIRRYLGGAAVPTYGPVPAAPPSPLASATRGGRDRYPFSVAAAAAMLRAHGWKVLPGGDSYCAHPGSGADECGSGVKLKEKITFNLDYRSRDTALTREMTDLARQAKKVGITIQLTTHAFGVVINRAAACSSVQPDCKWTAENWGVGWTYNPGYYPTGEDLFGSASVANYSNYNSAKMDRLIAVTTTGPPASRRAAMDRYVAYVEKDLPVIFEPTPVGTFGASAGTLISRKLGGYSANALGFLTPENWYLVK